MATIYLVRHGEKEAVIGDPGLTAIGHQQAQATAAYLAQFPISQIVASPLLRTQQTAHHLAEKLKLAVKTSDLLKERVNWGDDPNQTLAEFFQMWNQATWDRNYQPPVGDSSMQAGRRIEQALESLTEAELEANEQHLVLVTHGGVIADFLRNIFGEEKMNGLIKEFPQGKGFDIHECSVTILEKNHQGYQLHQLASRAHLILKGKDYDSDFRIATPDS